MLLRQQERWKHGYYNEHPGSRAHVTSANGTFLGQSLESRHSILKPNTWQRCAALFDGTSRFVFERTTSFKHGEDMVVQPSSFLHPLQQTFPSLSYTDTK